VSLGDGVSAGFTDRMLSGARPPFDGNLAAHVGDDPAAVDANRAELRRRIGAARLCFIRQVHGAEVVTVGSGVATGVVDLGHEADALVTAEPGTALAVLVADCLPVLLADARAGVVGAAHAGRPGLHAGVLLRVLEAMGRLGATPDRMVALVGPGICGSCYEVPAVMRDEVAAGLPAAAATTRLGTPALDLPAGAAEQLRAAGVTVRLDERCPAEDPDLFSYRRDGRTGRFAGWIVCR